MPVCDLPIDHLTFAAHDSLAPYSGPYPMTVHVRAALLKEINSAESEADTPCSERPRVDWWQTFTR